MIEGRVMRGHFDRRIPSLYFTETIHRGINRGEGVQFQAHVEAFDLVWGR